MSRHDGQQLRSFHPPAASNRPHDIEIFLAGYPAERTNSSRSDNLDFYSNAIPMRPENMKHDEFMRAYANDYEELEANHGYIQWLFPIREIGVNHLAQPLLSHEIEKMTKDREILDRLLESYTMMLRFYGIDFNGGKLQRSTDWKSRFENLHHRPHNLLRITRILKHLSEISPLQPHAAPLVLFLSAQHSDGRLDLSEGGFHGGSLDRWWSNVFRDEGERQEIRNIVRERGERGGGKWGEDRWKEWFEARTRKGWGEA